MKVSYKGMIWLNHRASLVGPGCKELQAGQEPTPPAQVGPLRVATDSCRRSRSHALVALATRTTHSVAPVATRRCRH